MIYKSEDRNKTRVKKKIRESLRSPHVSSLNINQFDFFSSASLGDKVGCEFRIQTSVDDL